MPWFIKVHHMNKYFFTIFKAINIYKEGNLISDQIFADFFVAAGASIKDFE